MDTTNPDLPIYAIPSDELFELLESTRPGDAPVRFRIKPDRRVRHDPAPVPDRRQP